MDLFGMCSAIVERWEPSASDQVAGALALVKGGFSMTETS